MRRSAFTLIEMMVVILIIAILVTLLSSAVVQVLGKKPEVETRVEISELTVALQAFMNDYQLSDPPPSALILREDLAYNLTVPLEAQSAKFLQKVFGKNLGAGGPIDWNGDGIQNGPWILEGEHCLIFYIGGIPNVAAQKSGSPAQPLGFNANNANPAAPQQPGQRRKGPYMDLPASRLVSSGNGGFVQLLDPWMLKTGPSPYVYYSSQGIMNGYSVADCQTVDTAGPYMTAPGQFTSPNTYQIISAGKDGRFGGGLWNPTAGATGAGADDQANFSSTRLGIGQN